jgi:hypothetical protein
MTLMNNLDWKGTSPVRLLAGPLGAMMGSAIAITYALLAVLIAVFSRRHSDPRDLLASLMVIALVVVPVGFVMGGIPSFFIGLFTGTLMGHVVFRWKDHLSSWRAILIGIGVSFIVIAVIHWLVWRVFGKLESPGMSLFLEPTYASVGGYLFWLGIPSLIYTLVNSGYAYMLYRWDE